jgi:tetratricopeptide (TPR) repeat protein
MKKLVFNFLLILSFISCDLSSGLYKEILEAQQLVKGQKFEQAVIKYSNILEKRPTPEITFKINFQLGIIYSVYLNQQNKAIEHYLKILDQADDPLWQVKVTEKLADIYYTFTRDFSLAKAYYNKLAYFEPKLEKIDFYQFREAMCDIELKNYSSAILMFKNIIKKNNHEYIVDSYYQLALAYFYILDWDQTITNLVEYIKRENDRDKLTRAKFLLANAYETSEDLRRAYNIYYSIIGDYPNPEVIKNRLNSLYKRRVARKR